MTTIAQTANVLIQGIEIGQEIYQTVLKAMDTTGATTFNSMFHGARAITGGSIHSSLSK